MIYILITLFLLFFLAFLYLFLYIIARNFADFFIFLPKKKRYENHELLNCQVRVLKLVNYKITSVFLEHKNPKATLMYFHGTSDDLKNILPLLNNFKEKLGVNVYAVEYAGYGSSGGKANKKSFIRSVDIAYIDLTENLKINPEDIIFYGFSLGSAAASYLAEKYPFSKALVLQGAFTSTFRVVLPFNRNIFAYDVFDNLKKDTSKINKFFIHGTWDFIVPFNHSKRLYKHALGKKRHLWIKRANHNYLIEKNPNIYWSEMQNFLEQICK